MAGHGCTHLLSSLHRETQIESQSKLAQGKGGTLSQKITNAKRGEGMAQVVMQLEHNLQYHKIN
jgi:hypothetical protein